MAESDGREGTGLTVPSRPARSFRSFDAGELVVDVLAVRVGPAAGTILVAGAFLLAGVLAAGSVAALACVAGLTCAAATLICVAAALAAEWLVAATAAPAAEITRPELTAPAIRSFLIII